MELTLHLYRTVIFIEIVGVLEEKSIYSETDDDCTEAEISTENMFVLRAGQVIAIARMIRVKGIDFVILDGTGKKIRFTVVCKWVNVTYILINKQFSSWH